MSPVSWKRIWNHKHSEVLERNDFCCICRGPSTTRTVFLLYTHRLTIQLANLLNVIWSVKITLKSLAARRTWKEWFHLKVSTVTADAIAPLGARSSTGTGTHQNFRLKFPNNSLISPGPVCKIRWLHFTYTKCHIICFYFYLMIRQGSDQNTPGDNRFSVMCEIKVSCISYESVLSISACDHKNYFSIL